MHRIPCLTDRLPDQARSALCDEGVVYLEEVKTDERLLDVAAKLGELITPGVGMSAGLHEGTIYSVAVRGSGLCSLDHHGHLIRSTTHLGFTLHTDGFNRKDPPHYVLLLRADEGSDRTASHVSDASQAIQTLATDVLAALREPLFPSALGPLPLVEGPSSGATRFRFNRDEIENWAAREDVNPPMDDRALTAVRALSDELESCQESFVIEPHDCLVLDNWRVCHGRSAMAVTSQRVLRRVWVV